MRRMVQEFDYYAERYYRNGTVVRARYIPGASGSDKEGLRLVMGDLSKRKKIQGGRYEIAEMLCYKGGYGRVLQRK